MDGQTLSVLQTGLQNLKLPLEFADETTCNSIARLVCLDARKIRTPHQRNTACDRKITCQLTSRR